MKPSIIVIGIALIVFCAIIDAQQPPKPAQITLNPAASKAVDDIEASKKACVDEAQKQESLILLGANVPKEFSCKRTESGWVCSAPEAAKSAEKK
jgi:hypothetical protein